MSATDYITDVTANLTEWGITYRETAEGVSVGNIHLEVAEDGYRPAGTILDGTETVAITSDTDKAAALLSFPLARKAWAAGYTGDFEIDVYDGMLNMRLSYGSDDVTIHTPIDSDLEFAVVDHPLFSDNVDMTDLESALESAQLAYQDPEVAWRVLCGATDFEHDDWEAVVERFHWQARFDHGYRLTKVSSSESCGVALVEDWDEDSPVRVIDVDTVTDVTYWAPSDTAAAVLYAIS